MSDIAPDKGIRIKIGETEVILRYTVASLHYLTSKYEDLPGFLKKVSGEGRDGAARITAEFIDAVCDFIYAGIYDPDDGGADVSGWTPFKIMRSIDVPDMTSLVSLAWQAFNNGAPKVVSGDPQ